MTSVIKALADYVDDKGLKLGIYSAAGCSEAALIEVSWNTLTKIGAVSKVLIPEISGAEPPRSAIPELLFRTVAPTKEEDRDVTIQVKFTTEATIVEVSDAKGWYYTKCCAKITQQFTDPQCRDHGPQPIPNYGIVIDDGTSTATITCFSLEAHTFVPECNEVVNVVEDKDTCHVPDALK
ncbi:DNA helicase [Tanacetum coccineum]